MMVFWYCGSATETRMMIIEMTIISSSRVKPAECRLPAGASEYRSSALFLLSAFCLLSLPVTVLISIQRLSLRFRVHIEDVLAARGGCISGVITRAKDPVFLSSHGIDGNLTQVDLGLGNCRISAGSFRRRIVQITAPAQTTGGDRQHVDTLNQRFQIGRIPVRIVG